MMRPWRARNIILIITHMANKPIHLIDMHSHFLPGIDDGCKTAEESREVLRLSRKQHVRLVVGTPHYYSDQPVADFLAKRKRALEQVQELLHPEFDWPRIMLGAEVAYHQGLLYEERLPELCYEGTHFLLLEMPFSRWSPNVLRDVERIQAVFGIMPVIAHIERYFRNQDRSVVNELMNMDVLIQINAAYVLNCYPSFRVRHLIRDGYVDLLGTDCHNLESRAPNLGPAADRMLGWGMEEELLDILGQSARVLGLN